jgi:hypothetical protein
MRCENIREEVDRFIESQVEKGHFKTKEDGMYLLAFAGAYFADSTGITEDFFDKSTFPLSTDTDVTKVWTKDGLDKVCEKMHGERLSDILNGLGEMFADFGTDG